MTQTARVYCAELVSRRTSVIKFTDDSEDTIVYEDERVAIEIGNGAEGATLYVFWKLAEGAGTRIERRLLELEVAE